MKGRDEGATPRHGSDAAGLDVAYRRASTVLSRRVGQEMIVASAVGEPHLLTGTGVAIWNLLRTPRTVSELVRELTAAYGAPHASVSSDVQPFLADLVSRGLVDEVDPRHA
jgi:hypothetical protein